MTIDREPNILPKRIERVALREDRLAHGARGKASVGRFFHEEYDLSHGIRLHVSANPSEAPLRERPLNDHFAFFFNFSSTNFFRS